MIDIWSNWMIVIVVIGWIIGWLFFIGAVLWMLRERKPTGKDWKLPKYDCDLDGCAGINQYYDCKIDECKKRNLIP